MLIYYSKFFIHIKVKLLFYCSYSKNASMVKWHFSHPEVQSKHIVFALGVNPTARDAMKARVPTSKSRKLHSSRCHAKLVSIHVPSLHKSCTSSLLRRQANAVEFVTKICFSLFDGSPQKYWHQVQRGNCATCGA